MKCSKRVLFFIIILYLPNGLSIDLMWIAEMGKKPLTFNLIMRVQILPHKSPKSFLQDVTVMLLFQTPQRDIRRMTSGFLWLQKDVMKKWNYPLNTCKIDWTSAWRHFPSTSNRSAYERQHPSERLLFRRPLGVSQLS
jgi:hypothetical protein